VQSRVKLSHRRTTAVQPLLSAHPCGLRTVRLAGAESLRKPRGASPGAAPFRPGARAHVRRADEAERLGRAGPIDS